MLVSWKIYQWMSFLGMISATGDDMANLVTSKAVPNGVSSRSPEESPVSYDASSIFGVKHEEFAKLQQADMMLRRFIEDKEAHKVSKLRQFFRQDGLYYKELN
ncbi:hypothetical protein QYM36_003883 [Artemia franciscana]|uniref:Uncharacterized protein n=1 Tax=Artemia franciscana TaxID=6661 RepID=A0AA88I4L0_ARTSF|nr:hypothetical protein QYM36_003883 [Artemia franciscana]